MKNIKKAIMIFIITIAITISFTSKYDSLIKELQSIGNYKQASVDDYIILSKGFVDDIATYGNIFFQQGKSKESKIYSSLKYNSDLNNYNLDDIDGREYDKTAGNLTGLGNIPKDGIQKEEVNLVFQYNEFFSKFYSRFPDVAWLYYTSENNFIYMYPWISSKDFKYTEDLKNAEFYKPANPQNNPERKAIWTPVYLDHAGKGLMVTLSSPIYDKDTFKGVVSLDLTNKKFSTIINSKYDIYLIDNTDSVIATNQNVQFDKQVIKLDTLLNISKDDIKKMKEVKNNSVEKIGKYYIYNASFSDAPWNMLVVVPVYLIIGKSALFTLPILIICILLLFAVNEVEIRKKAEKLLKIIAITDQVTGLNNRNCFEEKVLEEMERSARYNRPLSMIIFDLDYFKRINDTWGHPIGDEVLRQTAEITRNLIRKADIIFRVGGEEFVVLLPDTTINGAQEVAEKLRDTLDRNIHPTAGKFTASFGVGERLGNESFDSWYKNVDRALYHAKNKGRNRVVSSLELD